MTIIFPSPIFGPVHSRRLGVSLGINLLPSTEKYVLSIAFIVNVVTMVNIVLNLHYRPAKKSVWLWKRN